MAENNKNISQKYSDEELMEYLRNNVSGKEANALEKEMLEDPFLDEAMDGLSKYSSVSKIGDDIYEINTTLRGHTSRKRKKRRMKNKEFGWILYISFVIIILLLITFVVLQ